MDSQQSTYKSETNFIDTAVGYSLKKRKLKDWIYDNNFTQPYVAKKLCITKAELQRKLNEHELFNEEQIRSIVRLVGAKAAIDIIYFPTIQEKHVVWQKTFGRKVGENK